MTERDTRQQGPAPSSEYAQHALDGIGPHRTNQDKPSTANTSWSAVDDLWEQCSEIWGGKFTSQYGEEPLDSWRRILSGLTERDLARGLAVWCEEIARKVARGDATDKGWPPTPQELRGCAMRPQYMDPSHRPAPRALPKPKGDGGARARWREDMVRRGFLEV